MISQRNEHGSDRYSDQHATRAGLTVTQALLRGVGLSANLANLRQARIDTLASQHELRGFAEALIAQAEQTYWDYALAERDLVATRISEIQAVVDYLKAFVDLYRLEGSLLERRGISAPGDEPVELSAR